MIIEIELDRPPAPAATAARSGEIRVPAIAAAVASVLLAAVLVGCASGASSAEQATGPAPSADAPAPSQDVVVDAPTEGDLDLDGAAGLCAIFPADRAGAALGEPVGAGKATYSVSFGNASCTYDSSASDASITIWYHPDLTRSDWDAQMAKIGMTAEMAVSGIGEAAYRSDGSASHPRVKVAAFEGDHDIWVIITKAADVSDLAAIAEQETRDLLAALR